jgi:hypothetical protein
MKPLPFLCGALRPAGPAPAVAIAVAEGRAPWSGAVRLAWAHALEPTLWSALHGSGALVSLPAGARDFVATRAPGRVHVAARLEAAYDAAVRRNASLLVQARRVIGALNAIGIEPMPLKGLHHIVTGLVGDPGSRCMIDIDLLVPRDSIDIAREHMRPLGYAPAHADARGHDGPAYVTAGEAGSIELHREALAQPGSDVLSAAEMFESAAAFEWDGLRLVVPGPTTTVLHSMLHAQVAHRLYAGGIIPLRSLHEIALLDQAHPIDWDAIRRRLQRHRLAHVLDAHLLQLRTLFGRDVPAQATTRAWTHHARCLAVNRLPPRWQRLQRWVADAPHGFSSQRMSELYPDVAPVRARLRLVREKTKALVRSR